MKIAVVVPTIRVEQYENFCTKWASLFEKHQVHLYTVKDGKHPTVNGLSVNKVMGKCADLIYNFNDGVRNLGFAKAYQDGMDIIISLDDDTEPFGDTIQDHLNILNKKVSTTWLNTSHEIYMRGFPYKYRNTSEVVLSHGVWQGVADFDSITQLSIGAPTVTYPQIVVPQNVFFPMCIMNVAFKRKMTPYMYQAPMFEDINRFADIWGGIEAKKDADGHDWAVVTGFSQVVHNRASDPFVNLIKESRGIKMNEEYGKGDYFRLFFDKRRQWQKFLSQYGII